jgi:hypothetical protein
MPQVERTIRKNIGRSYMRATPTESCREFTHDGLAHDLALYLKRRYQRISWENVTFASPTNGKGEQRPDVFAIVPTLTVQRFRPWVFEVKVKRGDFLSELRTEKWRHHMRYAHRFYFACPVGLIDNAEVPEGCGLIVRSDKNWEGWKVVKFCKPNPDWKLTERDLARLILGRWADR